MKREMVYLFVDLYQTINHPAGLKELEFLIRQDCDCDCLEKIFGVCMHHERTCSLLAFFQKLCTVSFTLYKPLGCLQRMIISLQSIPRREFNSNYFMSWKY